MCVKLYCGFKTFCNYLHNISSINRWDNKINRIKIVKELKYIWYFYYCGKNKKMLLKLVFFDIGSMYMNENINRKNAAVRID